MLCSALGVVRALLEFYCEDIWYELVFQFLLPMKHFLISERQKVIRDINFQESTMKFLELVPLCMYNAMTTEGLAEHFALYVEQELQRIHNTDAVIGNALPLVAKVSGNDGVKTRNAVFPQWIFKYDGS